MTVELPGSDSDLYRKAFPNKKVSADTYIVAVEKTDNGELKARTYIVSNYEMFAEDTRHWFYRISKEDARQRLTASIDSANARIAPRTQKSQGITESLVSEPSTFSAVLQKSPEVDNPRDPTISSGEAKINI